MTPVVNMRPEITTFSKRFSNVISFWKICFLHFQPVARLENMDVNLLNMLRKLQNMRKNVNFEKSYVLSVTGIVEFHSRIY